MAQLKDLIVTGATRLIGDVFTNKIQITSISAPTSAGGTTYSLGTNGYVLKTNGSSVYWAADTNSLTGVKGNAESSYRTGNVNLTPANIGALALSGGTMTGAINWGTSSLSEFSGSPPYILGIEAFANGGATKWKAASGVNVGSADSAKWLMNRGTNVTIADSSWAHGQKGRGGTNTSNGTVWKQKWTQNGLTYTPSGGSATTLSDSGDIVYWLSQDTTSNNLWVNMAIDGYIYSHSGFKVLTQSTGYSEGIRFVNSSATDKGSIGCDTNGVLGLYGSSKVSIRPVINAATDGVEITTTSMVPTKATVALGTAANPWHNIVLGGTTNATMTAASTNPRITFQEGTGTQPVHLIYTDQDSYRNPAGLKVIGETSATPAWFEVEGDIYAKNIKITRSIKNLITGTGTAASDAGSGDNRYKPARWTFNTGTNAADGEIFTIKIPIAGHDYGVFMSVNNGTDYYPVVANGTGRITTNYPVDTYLQVIFESTGSAASMFPLAGGTARVTVSGGVFRVINYYDSNSNDTGYYHRKIYPNLKAGSNKIHPYTLIMENKDGRWESLISTNPGTGSSHAANTHGFLLGNVYCMYANATYNENATVGTYNIWSAHSGLIDVRYSFNLTSSAGITGYKPVYIVGTIGTDGLFYLDTTKWWAQDLPTTDDGKVYVYIGDGYDWYRMTLSEVNPAYFYRDSRIQMYAPGRGIKTITRSGTTFTATRDDGSTFTFTQQDNNSVTGVKGNAESSYRTGQVNLTPANIGAAAASHTHYELATIGDQRSTATTPNTYANRLIFQGLKTNSAFGSPSSDTYSYVVGLRGWSDSSGGNSHELAFNNTGIYHRSGATTSWGNWVQLVENTGTWGISITGNAATATTATTASTCSGNAATATKLATSRTISLTGSVTGSGSFDGSGNLSIATTTNHNHKTLTVGNKTYNGSSDVTIEIADLGLASTTTFIGLTSTNLSNGSTTNPVTITVGPTTGSVTATNGSVVMEADSGEEYIWSGNKWNLMGLASSWALANHIHGNITNAGTITSDTAKASGQHLVITDSNNKICRSALALGTATTTYLRNDGTWSTPPDTNKYHKTGSWNGLTYTATAVNSADELKFTVPSASTSAAGAVKLNNTVTSTSTSEAATANAVKTVNDGLSGKVNRSGDTMTGTLTVKGLKGTSNIDYGTTLPSSGEIGQIFFLADDSEGIPSGGTTGQFLRGDGVWQNTLTDSFIVNKGGTSDSIIRSANDNGSVELLASTNKGLYDRTNTKWAIAVNADGTRVYSDYPIYGAVWNDYAEYRASDETEAGRCVCEVGDGTLIRTTERLQKGCEIVSDTFGFAIGKTEKYNTPTAASGRVLAYLYEDKEIAKSHIGDPVCSGPNGTVSIMTEEEEMRYPSRIIGTISEIPNYDIWGAGHNGDHQIKVNGRVWIRVK